MNTKHTALLAPVLALAPVLGGREGYPGTARILLLDSPQSRLWTSTVTVAIVLGPLYLNDDGQPGSGKLWVSLMSSQAVEKQVFWVQRYLRPSVGSSRFTARNKWLLDSYQDIQLFNMATSMMAAFSVTCDAQNGFQENIQLSEL